LALAKTEKKKLYALNKYIYLFLTTASDELP